MKILTKNSPTPNVCFASLRAAKAGLRYASRGAFGSGIDEGFGMMFDVTKYGERIIRIGGKKYAAGRNQEEIHRSGKWSVHYRGASKSGFKNYCLYFDSAHAQKKVWSLGIKDGVFSKNHDFKDLRRNSPDTLAWLLTIINGERSDAPCPAGIGDNNKTGRPKKNVSDIPTTKQENYEAKKWSALPKFIYFMRKPAWPGGLFGNSQDNFGIDADSARDIFDVLRRHDFIEFMDGRSSKIKDVSDDKIYFDLYRSGEVNEVKGVDWIGAMKEKLGR